MIKREPELSPVGGLLLIGSLALILAIFVNLSRLLIIRGIPPFPPPTLAHKGRVAFDIERAKKPTLIACSVSPKGNVAFLDSKNGLVQVFSPDGKFLFQTPGELPGAGKLLRPLGLTFGENEEVFVADTGNQRVVQFSPDGTIKTLGKAGIFNGQFVLPTSLLAFDGSLFVLDSALCRVQQFNNAGAMVAKAGRRGDIPGAFLLPTALARDTGANLLVIDPRNSSLSQFDFLLHFNQQRKLATQQKACTLSKGATAGDGLSFFLSKTSQEIVVFYQNSAIDTLTPQKLGVESAYWTDLAGRDNMLYVLDGKNQKIDLFELQ